jgi:oxygen-independent coproporphyrinogen III oxidase
MSDGGYDGYAYAYPHKTAYRPLDPPVPLHDAWKTEDRRNLFLYAHLPFCEMRCGFCNLFTTVQPGTSLVDRTLAAIHAQSTVVANSVEPEHVAQAAFGGGTPSFLSEAQIEELFSRLASDWPVSWGRIPTSFEVSPGTVSAPKLHLLKALGVDRISLGVQSFVHEDLVSLKRPQPEGGIERACELIRSTGFPVFNIDLIYGNEGQDAARWQRSLELALRWQPEELYLYPLYVGKLTPLDRSGKRPAEHRRDLYRQARDFLLASGYAQLSMRLFRRSQLTRHTDYCCQEDGMVGLGPGARSYTRTLHYSTEYAVQQGGVRMIVEDFNARPPSRFTFAEYGATLDDSEQRRRYLIKSLLRAEGLSPDAYQRRFDTALESDFPELGQLIELGLATHSSDRLQLTSEGLAWSDTIGPWLYSEAAIARMSAYEFA